MDGSQKDHPLWRKLLSSFSPGWLAVLPDFYLALRRWWRIQHPHGMYEILKYDSTLELVDAKGETAIFKKQQRVKFLQNEIVSFPDYAWGDGEVFADYQCSPGEPVDRYKEGDRWNILISLRETKKRGDIEDFFIERMAKNGFTNPEESFQTEIRHQTERLKMSVIFPKTRRCREASLLKRSRNQTSVLGPEHFSELPDGRQILTWETDKARKLEIYTIKWQW